jgi:restriction endonuclease S subunit
VYTSSGKYRLNLSRFKTDDGNDIKITYNSVYIRDTNGVLIEGVDSRAYAVKEKYAFENYYFTENPNDSEGSPNYICKLNKIYSYSENGQDKYTIHPELLLNNVSKTEVPIDD